MVLYTAENKHRIIHNCWRPARLIINKEHADEITRIMHHFYSGQCIEICNIHIILVLLFLLSSVLSPIMLINLIPLGFFSENLHKF